MRRDAELQGGLVEAGLAEKGQERADVLLGLRAGGGVGTWSRGRSEIQQPYRALDCLKPSWDNLRSKVEAWR